LLLLNAAQAGIDHGEAIGDHKMAEKLRAMYERQRKSMFTLHKVDQMTAKFYARCYNREPKAPSTN
jgi:hypothetical protein